MRLTFALYTLCVIVVINNQTSEAQHIKSKRILKRAFDIKSSLKGRNRIAIDSAVDDIKESTAFGDREKKWKSILEGEMFPEHMQSKSKRIEVERNHDQEEANNDGEGVSPERVVGEKKNRIESDVAEHDENLATSFGAEGYDDSNEDNDGDDDSNNDEDAESGSGEAESGEAGTGADTSNGEPDKEAEESSTADRRQEGKVECHRKCSMPMTYHECAHPRCSLKVGSIKDLCFYLCKHQKERCEDVCE